MVWMYLISIHVYMQYGDKVSNQPWQRYTLNKCPSSLYAQWKTYALGGWVLS